MHGIIIEIISRVLIAGRRSSIGSGRNATKRPSKCGSACNMLRVKSCAPTVRCQWLTWDLISRRHASRRAKLGRFFGHLRRMGLPSTVADATSASLRRRHCGKCNSGWHNTDLSPKARNSSKRSANGHWPDARVASYKRSRSSGRYDSTGSHGARYIVSGRLSDPFAWHH